jgi:hypothetical protein
MAPNSVKYAVRLELLQVDVGELAWPASRYLPEERWDTHARTHPTHTRALTYWPGHVSVALQAL